MGRVRGSETGRLLPRCQALADAGLGWADIEISAPSMAGSAARRASADIMDQRGWGSLTIAPLHQCRPMVRATGGSRARRLRSRSDCQRHVMTFTRSERSGSDKHPRGASMPKRPQLRPARKCMGQTPSYTMLDERSSSLRIEDQHARRMQLHALHPHDSLGPVGGKQRCPSPTARCHRQPPTLGRRSAPG